jgi:amino acid adenylation domain-containing protein
MITMLEDSGAAALLTRHSLLERNSYTRLQGFGLARVEPCLTETRPSIRNLDDLPIPDRSLVDYGKYSRYIGQAMVKNSIALQATRGCPYNCTYCHKIWSKKHVMRSAENIFDEVRLYYDMGVKRFVFIDDIFNLNVENSKRFFQMIISNQLDVQFFFPNGIRGDILTKEYIDLMVRAGTVNLAMALETASPRLQTLIKKNLDLEKLHENIRYFNEKHPHVIIELFTMHGFPSETEEEAAKTLDFIKSLKWVHFPYVFILKIYPNTEMAELAVQNGVSSDAINRSEDLAFHELPETLPFDKRFTLKYQTEFLHEYFLNKERLLHVLPYQMKVLTEDELVQKYDSYLDEEITGFSQLLELVEITPDELGTRDFVKEETVALTGFNEQLREYFPTAPPSGDGLRVLLLDLSQFFTDHENMLYNVVDPPLGLMYLMSSLNRHFGSRVDGRIAKSRIDFDSYDELKQLLMKFKPHVIGVRTLTFYKDFFHKTVGLIRQWGIDVPILSGGPYATSSYRGLLHDPHIDLVVLGEGEITMTQVIEKIIANDKKLPGEETLKEIPGIVFMPREEKTGSKSKMEIMMLDMYNKELLEGPAENPPHVNGPGDLAYMIFTSGSTGKPKGVMVEHRNLNNLVNGLKERVYKNYNRPLNVCMLSPYVFDASVKQIFGALLQGHGLDIVPADVRLDGDRLIEFYKTHEIDVSDGTPTHLRLLLESMSRESAGIDRFGVGHFLVGGEALPKTVAESFFNVFREAGTSAPIITNVYGPTECCVDTSSFDVTAENIEVCDTIPIGKPMPNYRVFIVGKYNEPQPVGIAGELCVGGDGVARGYLNQPELSAVKFFDSSHTPLALLNVSRDTQNVSRDTRPSPPLYRTGDLARWRSDGNIEFLGRLDHQVKIRGFRVELGEIENQLRRHEGVKDAVVVSYDGKEGDKFLCAYIVTGSMEHGAWSKNVVELRKYLSQTLPGYMIPSYFMQVGEIPLTPNGKVNLKAMPAPGVGTVEKYTTPRNEVEKKMVAMWSEVLEVEEEKISIDTDFFQLGGHSLKAVILISRMHKEFNVRVPLQEIFKTPDIRGLARYIKDAAEDRYASIEPAEKKEYYALSPAQKRLYLLQQIDLESIGYNAPQIVRLEGTLDREEFEKAFQRLIKRHETLRTSFQMVKDTPVQKIHDDVEFAVEYHDLSSGGADVTPIINSFIRFFDLSRLPLLRVGLIKIGEARYILVVDRHHIISDAASRGILLKDLIRFYKGDPLTPLKLQYRDYSEWLNSERQKEILKQQEEHWLESFQGEIPVLNLPLDYARPAIQSFEGDVVKVGLNSEETAKLKEVAAQEGATLFMILLAIYNIFLAKVCGQEDIIVGTPVVGRRHADLENIMGVFINTLALRNYPGSRKVFKEFLKEVRIRTLSAFENQMYPFEELVENVSVNRDISRNPLFDTMFILHPASTVKEEVSDLRVLPFEYEIPISKFDLMLQAVETGESLLFLLVYCTKLFNQSTIHRFISFFRKIITDITADSDRELAEIEIMPEEQKKQVLFDFNKTDREYPAEKTLHQLFEEQVEQTPARIAVVGARHALSLNPVFLTYRQLADEAAQLAVRLREKKVTADTAVGLMVSRSIEMMVGIWGILKAGGAYLPIDPGYPTDRIKYMLDDSRIGLLVTAGDLDAKIGELAFQGEKIDLADEHLHMENKKGKTRWENRSASHHLAYLIYTSGSTGKPKGILIEHRNVVNFITGMVDRIGFKQGKSILALTTISFDIFVLETLLPLTMGMNVVIADEGQQNDPALLNEVILNHKIDMLQVTPSRLKLMMTGREDFYYLKGIKELIVGGEAFPLDIYQDLKQGFKGKLYNVYGPTETTVWSTLKDLAGGGDMSIGVPIANTQVYMLDRRDKLQPVGIAGELGIGGDGVGRGYVNNSEATHEKFIANPFIESGGERVYRTGDLARWLPDENIEFLDRIDHQVKIRGFRIEPGEIETQLLTHEGIKEAVVVVRNHGGGDVNKFLCAYFVGNHALPIAELREYLLKKLPNYMIPSHFVQLDQMPLTPNGKINRNALPAPEIKTGDGYVAPGNEKEEKLAQIWAEVLGIEKNIISMEANFFQLGGHSLKATIMIARIHKEFSVKLPLTEVFKNPTIKGLSGFMKECAGETFMSIEPVEKKDYYPLSPAQKRIYIAHQMQKESKSYNISTIVELKGELDYEKLTHAFNRLIQRHESLRTSFTMVGNIPAQVIHDHVEFRITFYQSGKEEAEKIASNFISPFDLSKAPLLRAGLIKIGDNHHILVVDMYHIITDGISYQVLVADFWELYNGNQLPPLRIQYKDFSEWQNRLLQPGTMNKQKTYWHNNFKDGDLPVLNMPLDYPRPPVRNIDKGRETYCMLGKELCKKIDGIVKKTETTLFIFLLAVYNILLSKYTRQEDFIVGTLAPGRFHADLEKVIGMFVNVLPIRNYPAREKTFNQFLEEVKENTLNTYENQGYPFDELIIDLDLQGNSSRNPLFDTVFTMNPSDNTAKTKKETVGLEAKPYQEEVKLAKFDLYFLVFKMEETVNILIRYSTELFKRSTIEKMKKYYIEILQQVVDNIGVKLKDINLSHDFLPVKSTVHKDDDGSFNL